MNTEKKGAAEATPCKVLFSQLTIVVMTSEEAADVARLGSDINSLAPPKILGSKATENFYLLPLHSSLFTPNAPENFEVRSNSEEVRSESYIGSDLSPNAPLAASCRTQTSGQLRRKKYVKQSVW